MRRAILAAVLLTFGSAATASAAPPPNDELAGALSVSVGTTVIQDTTEATTTDPFETSLNVFCGAPVVEHGVWFTITTTEDTFVAFDTQASDYAAGIMLFAGAPTPDGLLNCGPGRIIDVLAAGVTYNMLAFGDGLTPATSGTLVFEVDTVAPPPEIELAFDKFGTVDRNGVVRVSGTVTCTSEDGSGIVFDVFGELTQRVGRIIIRGFFYNLLFLPCDGVTYPWEAFAQGENGLFAGGKAATFAIAFGCADLCSEAYAEGTIQLRKGGKP